MQRYQKAMNNIERYLCSNWGLQYSKVWDLVNSEQEAHELSIICQKEFEDVNLMVELLHCSHGRIMFDRKLEFGRHSLNDRNGLIEKMKDWEFMKKNHISTERLYEAFYPETIK
jgi:hypothetical protein